MWIATGLLVPLSTLPAFVHEIGWFLGPYWGFRAIHEAVFGSSPWQNIGMCVVVSTGYFVLGAVVLARIRAGRARPRDAEAHVNSLRVFFVGGVMSYRALFNWINPWVFFPHTLGYPIFEILFFAYLGRFAGVESDKFFLIGNAFMAIAITGFFGMGSSIGGERRSQTLSTLLASPANRLALFLGRAVPSIVTGFLVAATAFAICSLILGVHFSASELAGLAVAALVASFACTSFGLCLGCLGPPRAERVALRRHGRRHDAARLRGQRPVRPAARCGAGSRTLSAPDARDRRGPRAGSGRIAGIGLGPARHGGARRLRLPGPRRGHAARLRVPGPSRGDARDVLAAGYARQVIESESQLRDVIGSPSALVAGKVADRLNDLTRQFIERSPFLCIATANPDGGLDVSPRGDPAGFVRILDERRLLLPDRPGNKIADTLTNLLADDRVALLFLIPGVGDSFRVNGRAEVTDDEELLAASTVDGKAPKLGILVAIEEAYTQCSKALIRSDLWNPEKHIDRGELPSNGEILRSISDSRLDPEEYDRERAERYARREGLY